jgi:metallo-beta-lactamase class B
VYADSFNPISAPGYLYSGHAHTPNGETQLTHSYEVIGRLSCDVLLTPHPELADLFGKLSKRGESSANPFVDPQACKTYVETHREKLNQRLADERNKK